jgi:hypothetical protein
MKKIIALFIMTCSFAAVHAQTKRNESRDIVLNGKKSTGTTNTNGREVVLGKSNTSKNGTSRTTARTGTYKKKGYGKVRINEDREKTNNGKHKGWVKGKGNQNKNHNGKQD